MGLSYNHSWRFHGDPRGGLLIFLRLLQGCTWLWGLAGRDEDFRMSGPEHGPHARGDPGGPGLFLTKAVNMMKVNAACKTGKGEINLNSKIKSFSSIKRKTSRT